MFKRIQKHGKNLMLFLCLVEIAVALYLSYSKLTHNPLVCGIGDCGTVQASAYSLLFGVPVAYFGVAFYFALFVFIYKDYKLLQLMTALWGVLFASYLTLLELFVINAICMWCVIQYFCILVITAIMVMKYDLHSVRSWRPLLEEGHHKLFKRKQH